MALLTNIDKGMGALTNRVDALEAKSSWTAGAMTPAPMGQPARMGAAGPVVEGHSSTTWQQGVLRHLTLPSLPMPQLIHCPFAIQVLLVTLTRRHWMVPGPPPQSCTTSDLY